MYSILIEFIRFIYLRHWRWICLALQFFFKQLDDEVTPGIKTKWKQSKFYSTDAHHRTIHHPRSQLTEMPLICNAYNHDFWSYIERCENVVDDSVHFCNSSCFSASDHCIRILTVSQCDEESDLTLLPFKIDERLLHMNEGHTQSVHLRKIGQPAGKPANFTVKFQDR